MNANQLADAIETCTTDPLHKQAAIMLHQQQTRIKQLEETQEYLYKTHDADKAQIEALKRPNNVVGVPADKLAEMQAEIEALKNGLSSAYWHNTFVEVKKPNSDLIYRFKLDDVCKHGVDDGACKECYIKEQEKWTQMN